MLRKKIPPQVKGLRHGLQAKTKTPAQRQSAKVTLEQQRKHEQSLSAAAASVAKPVLGSPRLNKPVETPVAKDVLSVPPPTPTSWRPLPHPYKPMSDDQKKELLARKSIQQSITKRASRKPLNQLLPRTVTRRTKSPRKPDRTLRGLHSEYSSIETLQKLLGVGAPPWFPEDAIIIALDTEFDPDVCQLGFSIIDTRDFSDLDPEAANPVAWLQRMKVQDYIYTHARHVEGQAAKFKFGSSRVIDPELAIPAFQSLLQKVATPRTPSTKTISTNPERDGKAAPKVVLVGHSLDGDLGMLARSPARKFSLMTWSKLNDLPFTHIFDTQKLCQVAYQRGAPRFPAALGALVGHFGVGRLEVEMAVNPNSPEIERLRQMDRMSEAAGPRVLVPGRHNAGNDAAYTMLALLFLATKWEALFQPGALPRPQAASEASQPTLDRSSSRRQAERGFNTTFSERTLRLYKRHTPARSSSEKTLVLLSWVSVRLTKWLGLKHFLTPYGEIVRRPKFWRP